MNQDKENHFPLDSYRYLATDTVTELSTASSPDFERRHFTPRDRDHTPNVRVSLVRLPHLEVGSVTFGCNMHAVLEQPMSGYSLLLPISGSVRNNQSDVIATANQRGLLFAPGELSDVDWSHDCTSLMLRIPPQELQQFSERVYGIPLQQHLQLPQQVELHSAAGFSLANTLHMVVKELDQEDSLFNQGITTKPMTELLMTTVLNLNPISPKEFKSALRNDTELHRAIDYIETHLERDVLLSDLTEASGISGRKLQSLFSKKFGMGPMSYIKQQKLSHVREALLSANPHETTVGDIAAKWGFYHASNFTLLYKKHFGEKPSDTLNRNEKCTIAVRYNH